MKVEDYEHLEYEKRISNKNSQIETGHNQIQEDSESIRINSLTEQSDVVIKKNQEI